MLVCILALAANPLALVGYFNEFVHLCTKYILIIFCVLGIELDACDCVRNEDINPSLEKWK